MNNNSDLFSIKDIESHTGLSPAYIDKCINRLKPFLAPHCKRGNNNSRLFTSNGLVIFDQIKQLKEQGLSLPEVYKRIETAMETVEATQSEPIETAMKTGDTHTDDIIRLLGKHEIEKDKLQREVKEEMEKRIRLQAEKDEQIRDLEREKEALSGAVKLLTAGKDPEQVKKDWENEQRRLIRIQEKFKELKTLGVAQWWRRKTLLKELSELLDYPNV